MNSVVGIATVQPDDVPRTARDVAGRDKFHLSMAVLILLIVAMGFSRTLYLRAFLDVPAITTTLIVHGIVLTMWFTGFAVQTALIATRRVRIHRRLGWALCVLAVCVVGASLLAMWNYVPRRIEAGTAIDEVVSRGARTLWPDITALLCFVVFFSTAVGFRRQREIHKRLMLLAAISILSPAMSRMFTLWRLPLITGVDSVTLALGGLFCLLVAVGVHDVATARRLHPLTLIGGVLFLGLRVLSLFVIAGSEIGRSMIRSVL